MDKLRGKTLVVYPYLHHYRRGVFERLDESNEQEFTFAADVVGDIGIETMPSSGVHRFHRLRTWRWRNIEYQQGLLGLIRSAAFDNVIFLGNAASVSTWVAAIYARTRGIRVLFWTIGWHRPDRGLRKRVRMAFYQLADDLLLYGNVGRQLGIETGYPAARMHTIGNSTTPSSDAQIVDEFSLPDAHEGVSWVGAVARLTSAKRFDLLVDACGLLRTRGWDVRVLLAGAGPQTADLVARAQGLGVPIMLPGAVYHRSQLEEVYNILDVTVVPAAVGLSAVQSLSFGTPVVSDDDKYRQMPEWESILPGRTGELYRAGDIAELAGAIERVLQALKTRHGDMAAACKAEFDDRWSPRVHADRILEVLGTST